MSDQTKKTNFRIFPSILGGAFGSGALTIVFTTPQIVNLTQNTSSPIPISSGSFFKQAGRDIFKRAITTQTGNKLLHFTTVRYLKKFLDEIGAFGAYNINIAYGLVAVPMQAWAYNSLTSDVLQYYGKSNPATYATHTTRFLEFYNKKIRPGIFWTFVRDSNSIGGGLLLGPLLAEYLAQRRFASKIEKSSNSFSGKSDQIEKAMEISKLDKIMGGLFAGVVCGFGTQMFHNAALTGGRAAELGENLGTFACLSRLWKENGWRCLYQGFPYRVIVIAGISSLLNLCEPFN